MTYRGSQYHVPVREYKVARKGGSKVTLGPPKGYGGGEIKEGDKVMVIPGCASGHTGGETGIAVPPEGPAWLAERGWTGVLMDDSGEVSNYQMKCLWKRTKKSK